MTIFLNILFVSLIIIINISARGVTVSKQWGQDVILGNCVYGIVTKGKPQQVLKFVKSLLEESRVVDR